MSRRQTPPEPYCSGCGRQQTQLRADGTVMNHFGPDRLPCAGSRQLPKLQVPTRLRNSTDKRRVFYRAQMDF